MENNADLIIEFWQCVEKYTVALMKKANEERIWDLGPSAIIDFKNRLEKLLYSLQNSSDGGFRVRLEFEEEIYNALYNYYKRGNPDKNPNAINSVVSALNILKEKLISKGKKQYLSQRFNNLNLTRYAARFYALISIESEFSKILTSIDDNSLLKRLIKKYEHLENNSKFVRVRIDPKSYDVYKLVDEWTTPLIDNEKSLFDKDDAAKLRDILTGKKIDSKINSNGTENEFGTWVYEMYERKMIKKEKYIDKKKVVEWIIDNFLWNNKPFTQSYLYTMFTKNDPIGAKRKHLKINLKKYLLKQS